MNVSVQILKLKLIYCLLLHDVLSLSRSFILIFASILSNPPITFLKVRGEKSINVKYFHRSRNVFDNKVKICKHDLNLCCVILGCCMLLFKPPYKRRECLPLANTSKVEGYRTHS